MTKFQVINLRWIASKLTQASIYGAVIGGVTVGTFSLIYGWLFFIVGGAIFGAIVGLIGGAIFLVADEFIGAETGQAVAGGVCGAIIGLMYNTGLELLLGAALGAALPALSQAIFRQVDQVFSGLQARIITGFVCGLLMGFACGVLFWELSHLVTLSAIGAVAGAILGGSYQAINQFIEVQFWET